MPGYRRLVQPGLTDVEALRRQRRPDELAPSPGLFEAVPAVPGARLPPLAPAPLRPVTPEPLLAPEESLAMRTAALRKPGELLPGPASNVGALARLQAAPAFQPAPNAVVTGRLSTPEESARPVEVMVPRFMPPAVDNPAMIRPGPAQMPARGVQTLAEEQPVEWNRVPAGFNPADLAAPSPALLAGPAAGTFAPGGAEIAPAGQPRVLAAPAGPTPAPTAPGAPAMPVNPAGMDFASPEWQQRVTNARTNLRGAQTISPEDQAVLDADTAYRRYGPEKRAYDAQQRGLVTIPGQPGGVAEGGAEIAPGPERQVNARQFSVENKLAQQGQARQWHGEAVSKGEMALARQETRAEQERGDKASAAEVQSAKDAASQAEKELKEAPLDKRGELRGKLEAARLNARQAEARHHARLAGIEAPQAEAPSTPPPVRTGPDAEFQTMRDNLHPEEQARVNRVLRDGIEPQYRTEQVRDPVTRQPTGVYRKVPIGGTGIRSAADRGKFDDLVDRLEDVVPPTSKGNSRDFATWLVVQAADKLLKNPAIAPGAQDFIDAHKGIARLIPATTDNVPHSPGALPVGSSAPFGPAAPGPQARGFAPIPAPFAASRVAREAAAAEAERVSPGGMASTQLSQWQRDNPAAYGRYTRAQAIDAEARRAVEAGTHEQPPARTVIAALLDQTGGNAEAAKALWARHVEAAKGPVKPPKGGRA